MNDTIYTFPKAPNFVHSSHYDDLQQLPMIWVNTEDELYKLIDEIDSVDRVALDTEFIKRNTYFPILALVQVNTGKAIYLVDAPKLDLSEFWQALAELPQMIWYACGEDLGIFYLLADCPPLTNVVDVQIGIAYLTGDLQVGYSRAVDEVLGISLAKSESQSDWLVRPLSHEQEQYAIDDVRYLLALHDVVQDALNQKNLDKYTQEDCLIYAKELYDSQKIPTDQLYLDLIAPIYTHEQITILQAVVAWRDTLARSINAPRSFIISKQALREIVLEMPTTIKALARTTINRASLRLYGKEIVDLVIQAKKTPIDERPPLPTPVYNTKDKPFKNELKHAITAYSEQTHIPDVLILKNRWIDELLYAVAQDDLSLITHQSLLGYRHNWIIQTAVPILQKYRSDIRQAMNLD